MTENFFEIIKNDGVVLIKAGSHCFDQTILKKIQEIFDFNQPPYKRVNNSTIDTKVSVYNYKPKTPASSEYECEKIKALFSDDFKNFIRKVTDFEQPYIERLQAHYYIGGDYIAAHVDQDAQPFVKYTFILGLDCDYDGGELVVHHPEKGLVPYKIEPNDLLILDARYRHEVTEITRGTRHMIIGFMMEESKVGVPYKMKLNDGKNGFKEGVSY